MEKPSPKDFDCPDCPAKSYAELRAALKRLDPDEAALMLRSTCNCSAIAF